ncbi:hypothetical protein J3E69DRAFT_311872 [Trichoderma sp. SZMC 28015]
MVFLHVLSGHSQLLVCGLVVERLCLRSVFSTPHYVFQILMMQLLLETHRRKGETCRKEKKNPTEHDIRFHQC